MSDSRLAQARRLAPHERRHHAIIITGLVVGAALVAGFIGAAASISRRVDTTNAIVTVTQTDPAGETSSAEPQVETGTAETEPADAVVGASTMDASIASDGKFCGERGSGPFTKAAKDNEPTSCPFALNLLDTYLESGLDGAGVVRAYSPLTEKWYDMDCSGNPAYCTGGVSARVLLYDGDLTSSGTPHE